MTRVRYISFGMLFVWIIQTIPASAQTRAPIAPIAPRAPKAPMPAGLSSQTLDFMSLDAATAAVVTGQPYSADGVTKITQTLADGTRISREVGSKFYRDSAGRVRREQNILGLDLLLGATSSEPQTAITITDPVAGVVYSLNSGRNEARRMVFQGDGYRRVLSSTAPYTIILPATPAPTVPSQAPKTESLGTRQIEGLPATGERTTSTIPVGRIGNDRPIEILDERWVSSDLKIVLLLRHRDPQTGEVEFRLTNIKRAEPPSDLFKVPANSLIIRPYPSLAPQ
jgi:hypothetical protein